MLLATMPLAAAQTGNGPLVNVNLQGHHPVPAQPGDVMDVYIRLDNGGSRAAERVEVEVLASDSFSPQGQSTVNAGTIQAWSSYLARFTIRVSGDAPQGDNQLRVRVRQQGGEWHERPVTIQVVFGQAIVQIGAVNSKPASLVPGQTGAVTVNVQNLGGSRLRDVSATLTLQETPFRPEAGSAQRKITSLAPQSSAALRFDLAVTPNAAAGIYDVPVTLSYLDEQGQTHQIEEMIGLRVHSEPQIEAYVQSVERSGDGVTVALRVVNKGLSEVRFAELSIGSGDFDIAPQDRKVYLGNIDSDDWETVRVRISSSNELVQLPIDLSYRDAFNQAHEQTMTIELRMPQPQKNNRGWVAAIILLAAILAGGLYWRKKR
jgi:hypothetical protein